MFHADGKETNRKEGQTRLERCALHARLTFRPQHTRRARPFYETRAQTAIPLYIRWIHGTHDRTRGRHGTFYLGRDFFRLFQMVELPMLLAAAVEVEPEFIQLL